VHELPLLYIVGGALTLVASPIFGKLADRYGKLRLFRIVAPVSGLLMFTITALPPVATWVAVVVFGCLMVSNVGRMIPAMAMITGSVAPRLRGGFMSANSSVQHIAGGIAASLGGLIITENGDGKLERFSLVGAIAAASTFSALWLAGRVRLFEVQPVQAEAISLAAAAEGSVDAGEAMVAAVEAEAAETAARGG